MVTEDRLCAALAKARDCQSGPSQDGGILLPSGNEDNMNFAAKQRIESWNEAGLAAGYRH